MFCVHYVQVLKVMSKSLSRVQLSLFAFSFSSMVHIGTNSKAFFIASAILFQTAIISANLCIVFIFLCSLGEVAKLFADAGVICIASLISPYKRDRDACRALMPDANFIEVGASCHCIFYINAVYRHHQKLPIYLRSAVLPLNLYLGLCSLSLYNLSFASYHSIPSPTSQLLYHVCNTSFF